MKFSVSLSSASSGLALAAIILATVGEGGTAQEVITPTTFSCPAAGGASSPTIITGSTTSSSLTIRVPIISATDGLCTLVRRSSLDGTKRVPVARSYAGRDWEVSAGRFSGRTPTGVVHLGESMRASVDCSAGGLNECDVTLPPLEDEETQEFVLESFVYSVSAEVEAARFLEQATFGQTRGTIDEMVSTSNDFETWIYDQMYTVPQSSLRQFYRKRVNPKWEHSYFSGAISSMPCERYSRWRKYAITSKDTLQNRKTDIYKILTVTHEAGIGYVWKIDGDFRTVTQEPPKLLEYYKSVETNTEIIHEGATFKLGDRYRLKYMAYWQADCVGCIIAIHPPAPIKLSARTIFFGISNPQVDFTGYESRLEYNVIDLPTFKSEQFPVIDNPNEYSMLFEKFIGYDQDALLNTTSLEAQCPVSYNFRQPRLNKDWYLGSFELWKTFPQVFGQTLDGHKFIYDPHLALYENTVENPSADGGGSLAIETTGLTGMSNYNGRYDGTSVGCQNAAMSYQNEGNCKLSYLTTACSPGEEPRDVIILNDANLEGIRAASGRALYAVTGWTIASNSPDTPCGSSMLKSQKSRWIKDEVDTVCANSANLGPQSIKIFQDIIDARDHKLNDNIVDAVKTWRECDSADVGKVLLGKVKAGDGSCWKHTHEFDLSVFDLSSWTDLSLHATQGSSVLSLSEEDLDNIRGLPVLGRYEDHLDLDGGVPLPFNDADVQASFKTTEYNPSARPVLICGTPNEIASDPFEGERGFTVVEPEGTGLRSRKIHDLSAQRHTIWYHLAMNGADQLRLRMAFALSQIIAVGLPGSGMVFYEPTEDRLAMYDLYVNRAFGSYLDLLKDFSYNKIMAGWLSFYENASLQYNLSPGGGRVANFPDENFAREIMQLFTIGLYHLNMDGTNVLLDNGKLAETYTIEDILSYSRAWTGFTGTPERGGVSLSGRQWTNTPFDPMEIDVARRDLFPKSDLMNGYIGDKLPLCVDLPQKHFLRKGAVYKLLGSNQRGTTGDHESWDDIPDLKRLQLPSSSPLFAKLCAEGLDGECTFPSHVILEENLVYDTNAQLGAEYAVDTIRTVKLNKEGLSGTVHYEYVRQSCVEHAFYNDGKKTFWGSVWKRELKSKLDLDRRRKPYEMEASMCANPRTEAAAPICSSFNWETSLTNGRVYCNYHGERMTFDSAEEICQANGLTQGQPGLYKENYLHFSGPCGKGLEFGFFRAWSNRSCGVKVKIDYVSGHVALVHNPGPDGNDITQVTPYIEPMVSESTLNFFKVPWTNNGAYPDLNMCLTMASSSVCKVHEDVESKVKYCLCDTDVRETQVFVSITGETWSTASGQAVSSIDDLMGVLQIGAVDPLTFDAGIYANVGECGIAGITVYTTIGGSCSSLSPESIFAFKWKSKQYFLKNVESMVHVDDALGNDYSFRNPVQFHTLANPSARDSAHETEAVLDSLFYHPTHPPYLAVRVINRFGVSNPSPGFVERVATAYSTGTYRQFGSGKYGDLGALVAAILLDDEARQVVLDMDQSFGQLREPLLKVMSFFRSQGLQFKAPFQVPTLMDLTKSNTRATIGQGAFESPSVFSFFLPEFSPTGVVNSGGLFAPESMILQGGHVLDLLEAVMSITKFGVVDCDRVSTTSFSRVGYKFEHAFGCPTVEGDITHSPAITSYWPSSTSSVDDILDELALLMTAGRLSQKNRALIKPIVSVPFTSGDTAKAVRSAQQLIWSTPEVHATNIPRIGGSPRQIIGYETPAQDAYKAVVVLMMLGGADSFNMLVPMQEEIWLEYARARGSHKLNNDHLLPLGTSGYGVHPALSTIANLYNDNEALWFRNLGTLAKKMTNANDYVKESKFQLFAHNVMQHEFFTGDPHEENPGTGVFGRMLDMLKVRGFHTSANSVSGGGETMLTGDQAFNNPVFGLSIKAPGSLDKTPTFQNAYDVIKEINGIGEVGNSFLSETWSSRLSTALFEHEQLKAIAENTEFNIPGYAVDSNEPLTLQLKAVAEFMKSRNHRKVNRDVFIVPHAGYDLHSGDTLVELITVVNDALDVFVKEMKNQGIWDNTVIVMGSDFGRTLNANANGGSDHAWGGNYFMLGGGVKGGQLLGEYPRPLNPTSEFFIPRGRLIPSTPWDAVWNGIGNWLGLYSDEQLNFALPNRDSFDKCNDLFFDKDLFKVGKCDCNGCSNVGGFPGSSGSFTLKPTGIPTTLNPTGSPTPPPTPNPTKLPTPSPLPGTTSSPTTAEPLKPPTPSPTTAPPTTQTPTIPLPDGAMNVNSIFDTDSYVTVFGCDGTASARAVDGTTEKFVCLKTGVDGHGIIVKPSHSRLSIAKGLRVYSHNNCPNCDVVSYIVEGRANSVDDWTLIGEGNFPWKDGAVPDRNARGSLIESSAFEGDTSKVYTEVFFDNGGPMKQYKLSFPETRDPSAAYLQFSEVELTGYVVEHITLTASPVTAEPTKRPTLKPTQYPTTDVPTSFAPTSLSSSTMCDGNLLSNSNFEDGMTDWRPWGGTSVELTAGVTGNAIKAFARTTWRSGPRQDLWQDDLACLPPGTFVHFEFKVKLVDDTTGFGVACDTSSSTDCPMVTVRHATWDYVYDHNNNMAWDPNNWNTFHGVYQVPTGAWATAVYVMICGGQPGTSLIVDEISMAIGDSFAPTPSPTPNPTPLPTTNPTAPPTLPVITEGPSSSPVLACNGNLLSNSNFEDGMTDWSAWAGASVEITPTGVTGNAIKAFARTTWRSGPRQDLSQDDLACLPPGTFVHFEFKVKLVDDATGFGVACDTSSSTDCPMVTVRHATWDYVYDHNNNMAWDPNNWNTFHGVYQVPTGAWATAVYVMICGGQPGTSLIVDEISMVIGDSFAPTPSPTFNPTSRPTKSPSFSPTTTAPIAAGGTPVNTIINKGSTLALVGCTSSNLARSIDRTTEKFACTKTGSEHPGIIATPSHSQMSIAQAVRVYSHNNCPLCDVVSYIVEGRVDATTAWTLISQGDLPNKDEALGRNGRGLSVSSTYESGDPNLNFSEVSFPSNTAQFLEYKISFPETRDPNYNPQLAELDLVGVLF